MNRHINLFTSEFRLIRYNFYIPIVIWFLYITFFSKLISLPLLQLTLTPMSSWWIIWTLEHNLKPSNYTLFKTIPIRLKIYFHIKFMTGTVLYSVLLYIGIALTFEKQEWIPLLILLLPQVLFFPSLSYALIILTKSASVSISLVYLYVLSGILPIVDIPFWPNVFFISQGVLEAGELLDTSIPTLLYASWFVYLANLFLNATSMRQE